MTDVRLTGTLRCRTPEEAEIVRRELPSHCALTRAEAGCLVFEVHETADPLVWAVQERFDSPRSFHAHQERVAASAWGTATAGIERRYEVTGI